MDCQLGGPFSLDQATLAKYECFGRSYMFRFSSEGHHLQVNLALGRLANPIKSPRAFAIIDSLLR